MRYRKSAAALLFVFSALVLTAAPAAVQRLPERLNGVPQSTATVERRVTSPVVVALPADDAELAVNGVTIGGPGSPREFATPPLDAGSEQKFTFTATWEPNTYTKMTRSKTVTFRAGETVRVDLSVEAPDDRVRVIYVPTPEDVAEAMVDLAGVTPADVVYEPGCGDARITIAAIRKGARRAICVDIDGERARESQENVKAAGMSDRIDVREGDALDVKDLSDVSVVFLYMGDHFNLLVRPVLWRELKVGSRIVSHRFLMGDWEPDKTVNVGDGGFWQLHLWTITEQNKRAAAQDTPRFEMAMSVRTRVVFDETKIDGIFDVDVSWRPENAPPDNPLPSLLTAIEERLGLTLTPQPPACRHSDHRVDRSGDTGR